MAAAPRVRARLAVLAGCDTINGAYRHAGPLGLVHALMYAGVPAVIGTAWDVEDAGASEFFRAFYAGLAVSDEPAAALRATQIAWIRQQRPSHVWAAVMLFGRPAFTHRGES